MDSVADGNRRQGERTKLHHWNGIDEVPIDVTHVRVDPSVTELRRISSYWQRGEYRVGRIGAFAGCVHLREVELPDGLRIIGRYTFYGCKSLLLVNIPSTVEEIGDGAFQNCETLAVVTLPDGLQRLGESVFSKCASLQRMKIPARVETIERSTFDGCISLIAVTFSDGRLNKIADNAFRGCTSLVDLTFSEGLTTIGFGAFHGCKSLRLIRLPSTVGTIDQEAFHDCERLAEISLPDAVKSIKGYAFSGCNFLNFRFPPLVTKLKLDSLGQCHDGLVSLELSESVNRLVEKYESTLLPSLRNIALPPGCKLRLEGGLNGWFDIKRVFPGRSCDEIATTLRGRFDELPVHKHCYYQSYQDHNAAVRELMSELDREISPCGVLHATGKQQDCLGMTPLHILACSTQQHRDLYRVLVGIYPETLIVKDKWGGVPLLYAVWCNAPAEIIQFLVESYKSHHPGYAFDWADMVMALCEARVPPEIVQKLVDVQESRFAEQPCDLQHVVIELARLDSRQENTPLFIRECTLTEVFRYVFQASVSKRLESLNVARWQEEIENHINGFPEVMKFREQYTTQYCRDTLTKSLYERLSFYESLKEASTMLELTMWKINIDEHGGNPDKRARVNQSVHRKAECRFNCGADIVVRNVMPYLLPASTAIPGMDRRLISQPRRGYTR